MGKGTIVIDKLSINAAGQPHVNFENKSLKQVLELDDVTISCDSFTADLDGGDISIVINGLTGIVTAFIREYVMKTFDDKMRTALSNVINDQIVKVPHTAGKNLTLDYNLVKEGIKVND